VPNVVRHYRQFAKEIGRTLLEPSPQHLLGGEFPAGGAEIPRRAFPASFDKFNVKGLYGLLLAGRPLALLKSEVTSMKSRLALMATVSVFAVFVSTPAHLYGQQPSADAQHEQHHPAATPAQPTGQTPADMMSMMSRMKTNDVKLDELVKNMNTATGSAKTDAMAQLLAALVDDRRNACEPMMANMMSMMNMMGGRGTQNPPPPATPNK
jgi:hypothetical protein